MGYFHKATKQTVKDSFFVLNDFTGKFPKLTIEHVDLAELAKHYRTLGRKVEEKDLVVAYVFMDCMRVLNEHSEEKIILDLNDVKHFLVKKKDDEWKINIYNEKGDCLQLKHRLHIEQIKES